MTIQKHIDSKYDLDCENCGGLCCKCWCEIYGTPKDKEYDGYAQDRQLRFSHLKNLSDKAFSVLIDDSEFFILDDPCEYFVNGKCSIYSSENRPALCKNFPYKQPELCQLLKQAYVEVERIKAEQKTNKSGDEK